MNIKLDTKQLQILLTVFSWADTVKMAFRAEMDEQAADIDDLFQEILRLAHEAGMNDWVERNEENGQFKLNMQKELDCYTEIERFENGTFWRELADRLAERDMLEKYGDQGLDENTMERELDDEEQQIQMYENEFMENGIMNLRIINPQWN